MNARNPITNLMKNTRPATILAYEDLGTGILCTIAAFRVHLGQESESLAFRCPFCLKVHFHRTFRSGFGECNDQWTSHCLYRNCLNERGYKTVEIDDPEQAGDLPARLIETALRHRSRLRLAELRKG